jgi:hypothetical protein
MGKGCRNLQAEAIAALWSNSGITQVEFAKSNNISIHTLKYWLYKRNKKEAGTGAFTELKSIFKENNILLRYPNGVELHIPPTTSLVSLRALINL